MTQYQVNNIIYSKDELLSFILNRYADADEWEKNLYDFMREWLSDNELIPLHTSGSTGIPRVISFPRQAFVASAMATISYFNIKTGNNLLLCLPAQYVAARLMVVRAFVGGCNLILLPPTGNPLANLTTVVDFAAMVPLQVSNALVQSPEKFNLVRQMIIGGSAVTDGLKSQLSKVPTTVWETYGMTETLTHVAIRCINGDNKNLHFEALPGVSFTQNASGCLVIDAPHISAQPIETNDIVTLSDATHFKLLGRIDCVINTGGVKIHAEQLEAKLKPFIQMPFAVFASPDSILGQKVTLVIEGDISSFNSEKVFKDAALTKFETPRLTINVSHLPLTESGKIKRSALIELIGTNS